VCVLVTWCRFIATYNDVKTRSPDLSEEQLLTSAADVLRSSGVTLRSIADIQKVCCNECLCYSVGYSTESGVLQEAQLLLR